MQVTMVLSDKQFYAKIGEFIRLSHDGYAVFDSHDILIGCNPIFADIYDINHEDIIGLSFNDIIKISYVKQRGAIIHTDNIEQWLASANTKRRSQEFRLFEIDLYDGRWLLLSEQTLATGEMLLHTKDITKQKNTEQNLSRYSQSLFTMALTDELTQIANRRCFIESVNAEISRCLRQHTAMAFLLIDIDYFKQVNDTYGHLAGDNVLVSLSKVIKNMLREYDIFGRLGGEEFAIFLSETSVEKALEVAERIRERILQHDFIEEGQKIKVTLSIGVSIPTNDSTFKTLYKDADTALYAAKNSGRNRVSIIKAS